MDFREVVFERFTPDGCVFVNCDFSGLVFDRKWQPLFSSQLQSVFRHCRFDDTDLAKADPGQTRFEDCSFTGAKIEKWYAYTAEFVGCVFSGPITQCKFYGRPWGVGAQKLDPKRATNEFRDNDFSRADLVDTIFIQGIRFNEQRWPDGPDWIHVDRFHQRSQRARAEVMRWKDHEGRPDALAMLVQLQTMYGEQTELVCRRFDPRSKVPPATQERVWQVLAQAL